MHGLLTTDRVPPGGQVKIFRKKWNPVLCSDGSNSNTKSDVVVGPMGKIFVTHGAIYRKQKFGFGANFGWVLDLERTMFPTSDSKMQNMKKVFFLQIKWGGVEKMGVTTR